MKLYLPKLPDVASPAPPYKVCGAAYIAWLASVLPREAARAACAPRRATGITQAVRARAGMGNNGTQDQDISAGGNVCSSRVGYIGKKTTAIRLYANIINDAKTKQRSYCFSEKKHLGLSKIQLCSGYFLVGFKEGILAFLGHCMNFKNS